MKKPGSGVSAKACPASALAALAAAVLVLAAAFALAGCSAGMPAGPDVAPAFGDPYQEAEEAVRAHADDAALPRRAHRRQRRTRRATPWVLFYCRIEAHRVLLLGANDRRERRRGRVRPALADAKPMGRHREAGQRLGGARQAVAEAVEASGKAPTSYNASLVTFEDTSGGAGLEPDTLVCRARRPDGRRRGQHGTLRSGGALEVLAPTIASFRGRACFARAGKRTRTRRRQGIGRQAEQYRSSWGRRPGRRTWTWCTDCWASSFVLTMTR